MSGGSASWRWAEEQGVPNPGGFAGRLPPGTELVFGYAFDRRIGAVL